MRVLSLACAALIGSAALCAGCATSSSAKKITLDTAVSPAWSVYSSKDEMEIAVSPARQTLQLAGTAGTLIGAGISAAADAKYRKQVMEALGDYDAGEIFEQRLAERLEQADQGRFKRVAPLGSTIGYRNKREAQRARYSTLARAGHDVVLDLKMSYGIFGPRGILVAKLDGRMLTLPRGHELWDNTIVVTAPPILASDKLADPTKRLMPNFSSPRLRADEDAIAQWTQDGGELLRLRFEQAIDGVVSALLVDLGLADEPLGAHYLGKLALLKEHFDEATRRFEQALRLDPDFVEARNGLAVTKAHQDKIDDAIAISKDIVKTHPDYGAAYYNLAWWYAVEKDDAATARPYYKKALELGMPESEKLEKILAGE